MAGLVGTFVLVMVAFHFTDPTLIWIAFAWACLCSAWGRLAP